MKRNSIDVSLQDDTRAVAPLIGFILLFGFLVIAFTGYQAQVVPQQNAETEFEHFQQNHNEMVEFRSAILTAGSSDRPQYPTVQLGINYQTRILAVNGPPPAGLLQTSDAYPITISDGTTEVVVDTRFIEYQPGYNELNVGSTWYENSVLYLDELESSGGLVIVEDQNLVTDGDTLRITALQNDFQRSGTNRITVELYPTSVAGNISDLEENEELTVSLPTRLDSDYWEGQFEGSSSVEYDEFEDSGIEPDINMLNLTVNNVSNLELNTVGIREEPTEGAAKNIETPTGDGDGDDGNGGDGDSGDPLPAGSSAFNDQNGNGVYDNGEPSYTERETAQFDNDDVDLVIESNIENNGIDIQANTVTVRDGVTIDSRNDDISIDSAGDIDISGATLSAGNNNNNGDISLSSDDGSIDARDAILRGGQDITASADDGTLSVNDGTIIEDNNGVASELEFDGESVDGSPGKGSISAD